MKDNLKWVVENIKQDGYSWRGFFASDILLMSEEDFYLIFPEKLKQLIVY